MTSLTENEVDDLVGAWHDGRAGQGMELSEFITDSTGMTDEEYHRWVVSGELPRAS